MRLDTTSMSDLAGWKARRIGLAGVTVLAASLLALTASGEESATELAKQTQNPVSDLISVPFQNITSFETGPRDRTQNVLNIQPVVPFQLGEDWNLITRTILPIVSQPSFARGQDRISGTGDINASVFLSPKAPAFGSFLWGAGPIVNLPTASDDRLGMDAWGGGISGVIVVPAGPVVTGALVNNVWNFEGDDSSRFLLQPFLSFNFPGGWYVSTSPIITADWDADDDAWLVPVGGGFGKVQRFGRFPINLSIQAYYNAERPRYGSDWSLRTQIQLLFPKIGGQ